jgi:hypothetical protein
MTLSNKIEGKIEAPNVTKVTLGAEMPKPIPHTTKRSEIS